jgi:hypothetical protein
MNRRTKGRQNLAIAVTVALGLGACADSPVAPNAATRQADSQIQAAKVEGTGLVLNSVTGLTLPLIGQVGDVVIDQVNVTRLVLVEDVVGNIVGVQAEGVIKLTGGVLGTDVVTEDFLTQVDVASSGPGQCDVVSLDLGPIALDLPLGLASVDVPAAQVTPRASGALGPLLCNLGSLLDGPLDQVTSAVRAIINAINRLI